MTGKRYYITTLGAWHRHAARFTNSHWLALDSREIADGLVGAQHAAPGEDTRNRAAYSPRSSPCDACEDGQPGDSPQNNDSACAPHVTSAGAACCAPTESSIASAEPDATPILVLVEADEGAHLELEDDAAFEALPHPLAQKPISHSARAALAAHSIPYGATTFDVAEAVAHVHPLLRHRVF